MLALFLVFFQLVPFLQKTVQLVIDSKTLDLGLGVGKHLCDDVFVLEDAQRAEGLGDCRLREEVLQPLLFLCNQLLNL